MCLGDNGSWQCHGWWKTLLYFTFNDKSSAIMLPSKHIFKELAMLSFAWRVKLCFDLVRVNNVFPVFTGFLKQKTHTWHLYSFTLFFSCFSNCKAFYFAIHSLPSPRSQTFQLIILYSSFFPFLVFFGRIIRGQKNFTELRGEFLKGLTGLKKL